MPARKISLLLHSSLSLNPILTALIWRRISVYTLLYYSIVPSHLCTVFPDCHVLVLWFDFIYFLLCPHLDQFHRNKYPMFCFFGTLPSPLILHLAGILINHPLTCDSHREQIFVSDMVFFSYLFLMCASIWLPCRPKACGRRTIITGAALHQKLWGWPGLWICDIQE